MKSKAPTTADDQQKSEGFDPAAVKAKFAKWFPDLSEDTRTGLLTYQTEMIKFTKTLNLISSTTIKNAESVHIGDSVLASKLIVKAITEKQPLYDFGSGNGCPGLVYAILNPSQSVILVDRDQRKMEFCKHVASMLKLTNLSISIKGVEELEDGSVKYAVARGFAPFPKALLACRKQIPKGGRFFHMKSDGWANELAQMPSQLFTHWTPSVLGQYRLPESTVDMFVIQTEKLSS